MNVIYKNTTNEIEIKKSRFITNLIYVDNEDDANIELNKIKKNHYDAKHNCFSYIIGKNMNFKKQSDDGEPKGTAGIPMLNVLENNSITNCLAVVTRYFGGILLGAGGLLRAYVDSITEALKNAILSEVYDGINFYINTDYQHYSIIEKLIENYDNIHLINSSFYENIKLEYVINKSDYETFKNSIINVTNGKINLIFNNENSFIVYNNKIKTINLI